MNAFSDAPLTIKFKSNSGCISGDIPAKIFRTNGTLHEPPVMIIFTGLCTRTNISAECVRRLTGKYISLPKSSRVIVLSCHVKLSCSDNTCLILMASRRIFASTESISLKSAMYSARTLSNESPHTSSINSFAMTSSRFRTTNSVLVAPISHTRIFSSSGTARHIAS